MGDGVGVTPDHETEPAFEAEHTAACSDVDIADTRAHERGCSVDDISVEAVAAVDDDVAPIEVFSDIVDHLAGESGGNHDPDGSRGLELGGEIIEGGRARCPSATSSATGSGLTS